MVVGYLDCGWYGVVHILPEIDIAVSVLLGKEEQGIWLDGRVDLYDTGGDTYEIRRGKVDYAELRWSIGVGGTRK